MTKEQELINQITEFYYSHPYYKEFLNSKLYEQFAYGTAVWSDKEIESLYKKIEVENEVAKYFRAN